MPIARARRHHGASVLNGWFGDMGAALQIFGPQPRVLRDTGKHAGTDFIAIMKREDEIRPTRARQGFVRP